MSRSTTGFVEYVASFPKNIHVDDWFSCIYLIENLTRSVEGSEMPPRWVSQFGGIAIPQIDVGCSKMRFLGFWILRFDVERN